MPGGGTIPVDGDLHAVSGESFTFPHNVRRRRSRRGAYRCIFGRKPRGVVAGVREATFGGHVGTDDYLVTVFRSGQEPVEYLVPIDPTALLQDLRRPLIDALGLEDIEDRVILEVAGKLGHPDIHLVEEAPKLVGRPKPLPKKGSIGPVGTPIRAAKPSG